MRKLVSKVLMILIPIALGIAMGVFFMNISIYNKTERKVSLSAANMKDGIFSNDDIKVKLTVRGGDSGAWLKDPIFDDNDVMQHGPSVGTIYEVVVYNVSKNILADWDMKIPINEFMWANNSWNSKLEIHQDVASGNEKVMDIDLSDYSDYDITLDYYVDPTGPMIPLYKGDYFIYHPDEAEKEKPVSPSKDGEEEGGGIHFGYIMYIPDKTVSYVSDFTGGEFVYYMKTNPFTHFVFWIIAGLMFIYLVWLIIVIIVNIKVRQLVKRQELQKQHDEMMVEQTMKLIINMIETKDTNTKGHSIRVASYAKMIAELVGYNEDECQNVYYIGLLHDCGKVSIPNTILKNPGKLTDDEYTEMKKHTVYGGEVLKDFSSIENIAVGAKSHHERYDGSGYPAGLKGEEIPEIARIIGVADAFDAMNSKRCYRDKLPKDIIIKELEDNKGKQFDPRFVDCMLKLIEDGKVEI